MTVTELKDTVKEMKSRDYKKRFVAEYWQLSIRYYKLRNLLVEYDAHKLKFKLNSPVRVLRKQLKAMGEYLYCLEVRAKAEDIDLEA